MAGPLHSAHVPEGDLVWTSHEQAVITVITVITVHALQRYGQSFPMI